MKRTIVGMATAVAFFGATAVPAFAAGIYPTGTTGYDVSYPEKTGPYPATPIPFGIVGVTQGKAYTHNAYLATEFAWASLSPIAPSLYVNLNAPVGTTVKGNTATPKTCAKNDKNCQAYNYGYNAAHDALSYANSAGASSKTWWLDIETANSWAGQTNINNSTIQGAMDALAATGATVGIYSMQSMWSSITGGYVPSPLPPTWVPVGSATDHTSACSSSFITGSPVWLVQYETSGIPFDQDYGC